MKFNPEIFVQLKTGTCLSQYKMGKVLGEGYLEKNTAFIFFFRGIWESNFSNSQGDEHCSSTKNN